MRDFGVALSGGGVRASAFALGALLYLVDSGLNRRVSVISSVSGASLTNGFILSRADDFGQLDPPAFDAIARELIRRLINSPVMSVSTWGVYLMLFAFGAVCWSIALWSFPLDAPILVRAALPILWGTLFLRRARPIEWAIERQYLKRSRAKTDRGVVYSRALGRKRSLDSTSHVFCTTDQVTQAPLFFVDHSGCGLAYSRYGWFDASAVRLATAVRASAALPGGFPPRALRTSSLTQASWRISKARLPRWFHLSDGGVWDNLGTQWFDNEAAPQSEWKEVAGHLAGAPSSPPHGAHDVRRLLVVDGRGWGTGFTHRKAHVRSLMLRTPLVAELMSLLGASSIQYENTVEPRTRAYTRMLRLQMKCAGDDVMLASVATLTKHPLAPAASEVEAAAADPGTTTARREALLRLHAAMAGVEKDGLGALQPDWLSQGRTDQHTLGDLYRRSADVATKLTSLSPADAMALVIHGYVQAMGAAATMVAMEDGLHRDPPITFPGFGRFERLLVHS